MSKLEPISLPETARIPPDMLSDETYNIWVQLHRVNDLIERSRERELAGYGIPIRQMATLFAVVAFDNKATLTRLAQFLGRRPHTISSILTRMEKGGLIKKSSDPARKNVVRVALTARGRQAYEHSTRRESINAIIGALPGADRKRFHALLDVVEARAVAELAARSRAALARREE